MASTSDTSRIYHIGDDDKGLCVIINIDKFDSTNLSTRPGSKKDADDIEEFFGSDLKYMVQRRDNLKSEEFFPFIDSITQLIGHSFFIVTVFLLSHGEASGMYGSDGKLVQYSNIVSKFNNTNCPGLLGKPRVFVIQACRKAPLHQNHHELVNESDFLVIYSTLHNEASERHVENGSIFIQTFIQCLQKYSQKKHLVDIVTECNGELSEAATPQTCPFNSSLKKKVYLAQRQKQRCWSIDNSENSFIVTNSTGSQMTLPDGATVVFSSSPALNRNWHRLSFYSSLSSISYTADLDPKSTRYELTSPDYEVIPIEDFESFASAYPLKSTEILGHCIIIDNDCSSYEQKTPTHCLLTTTTTQSFRKQVRDLAKVFQQHLGFHVQCFTNINALTMRVLFDNLDTFPNPSALVVIILSKGRHPAVYDNKGHILGKDEILASFDNKRFQNTFPKLIIIHTTLVKQPSYHTKIDVPDDCICANLTSTDDESSQLKQLTKLIGDCEHDCHIKFLLQKVTKREDCLQGVDYSVVSKLKKSFILPVRSETHQPAFTTRRRETVLKLMFQFEFWSSIRIDSITALCKKRDNPGFNIDCDIIKVNHHGSLRTFIHLDTILSHSINQLLQELREITEALESEGAGPYQSAFETYIVSHPLSLRDGGNRQGQTDQQKVAKTKLTAIESLENDVDEIKADHKSKTQTAIHNLTSEHEDMKQFLFSEMKETAL